MNPMWMSIIALVVVFIAVWVVLYYTKWNFVLKDPKSPKKEVAVDKAVAYSGLVAILAAIIVLLASQGGKGKKNSREAMMAAPSYSHRFRYCGDMH